MTEWPDGTGEAMEQVTAMVEKASAAAVATDQDNRVVAWNEGAEELLGERLDDARGALLGTVLQARDVFGNRLCDDACALHAMVRNSESVQSFDLDVIQDDAEGEDPSTVRVAVSVVVVLSPSPGRYHLVYFLRYRRQRRRADAAIDLILDGGGRVPPPVLDEMGRNGGAGAAELTRRQTEVLRHIAEGFRTQEIADNLHISVNTVRNHTQNILRKLDVHSKTEAVSVALRQRLI